MTRSYILMGSSTMIRHMQHLVQKASEGDMPILITGESGTGKDILARFIHERSHRAEKPFLSFKVSSCDSVLLESELFGYMDPNTHHFTPGVFHAASGGTLFIDEVGLLPLKVQGILYRYLTEGLLDANHASAAIPEVVRMICGNSQDLEQSIRQNTFRDDFFYKLSNTSLFVPPLRERREDIPLLAEFFLSQYNQQKGKRLSSISHDAMSALLQHTWPHNLRELENLIERIVVLKTSGSIELSDLPPRLRSLVTDNIDSFYHKNQNKQHAQNQNYQGHPQMPHAQQAQPNNTYHTHSQPHHPYGYTQPHPNPQYQNHQSRMSPQGTQRDYRSPLPHQSIHMHQNVNTATHASHSSASQHHVHPYGGPVPRLHYQQRQNTMPPLTTNPSQNGLLGRFSDEHQIGEIDHFIKKDIDLGNGIDFYRMVEEFENKLISEALRRTNHNKNRAAQLLSMNRTTLVEKLKKRQSNHFISKSDQKRVRRNAAFTIFDSLGSDLENNEFESMDFLSVMNPEDHMKG